MPTARSKANRKYNEKAYDRISLMIPKGQKTPLEQFAREQGQSVNGLITCLIQTAMGLTAEEWRNPPEAVTSDDLTE